MEPSYAQQAGEIPLFVVGLELSALRLLTVVEMFFFFLFVPIGFLLANPE